MTTLSLAVLGLTQATGNERPSVGLGTEEAQFKATSGVSVRRAAKQLGGGPVEYFRWARSSLAACLFKTFKARAYTRQYIGRILCILVYFCHSRTIRIYDS